MHFFVALKGAIRSENPEVHFSIFFLQYFASIFKHY